MSLDSIRIAIAGAGYWGINHVRVFSNSPRANVTWVCDSSATALERAAQIAPTAQLTVDFAQLLAADNIDAIVIATPAVSHARLAIEALRSGKHVFVEKPLALSSQDAVAIREAATEAQRTVVVGHLMLFHPAVTELGRLLRSGALGDLYYLYASRVNLGKVRTDENALWSFAPHDLSMIDFLLDDLPTTVSARGQAYLQSGVEDVVFLNLAFADGRMANVHLSWLDPHKERRLTVVCSRKMVVFDDVSSEKLKIYDKGYDRPPEFTSFDQFLTLRQGDIHVPHLNMREPLATEASHFIDCVLAKAQPIAGLDSAIRIVRVLEAAQHSLERAGEPVSLERTA